MTRSEPIEWLQNVTGVGSIRDDWDGNPKHARRYQRIVTGKVAVDLAKQLRPFLRLKFKQVDIIAEFQDRIDRDNGPRAWMEEYLQRTRQLNRRGYRK